MKTSKYLMGLAIVAASLLTASCDTDNKGAIYEPQTENVTFLSSGVEVEASGSEVSVPVKVVRANTSGAYTAHYTLTSDNAEITDANGGTVTFAEGQGSADITVNATGLKPGNTYTATITLSDADQATADTTLNNGVYTTKVTITVAYVWTDLGVGSIKSGAFEDSWQVEFQKADGFTVYKAKDLYENGHDIIIAVDGNKATVAQQYAWTSGDYGEVDVKGSGTVDGKTINLTLEHFVPGVGSFGAYSEVITLP